MIQKLLWSLFSILPVLAHADQYHFSPFTTSSHHLLLRQLATLPRNVYASAAINYFPDKLSSARYAPQATLLESLIRDRTAGIHLTGGYRLNKQDSLESELVFNCTSLQMIPSLVYKKDKLYQIDKFVVSGKCGLIAPMALEKEYINVEEAPIKASDSISTTNSRSSAHSPKKASDSISTTNSRSSAHSHKKASDSISTANSRSNARSHKKASDSISTANSRSNARSHKKVSDSISTANSRSSAHSHKKVQHHKTASVKPKKKSRWSISKNQASTNDKKSKQSTSKLPIKLGSNVYHSLSHKENHNTLHVPSDDRRGQSWSYSTFYRELGLSASLSGCYPLHPNVFVESALRVDLPLKQGIKTGAKLPFGFIVFIHVGLRFNFA